MRWSLRITFFALPAILAAVGSCALWGYAFTPPSVDRLAREMVTVEAVGSVAYTADNDALRVVNAPLPSDGYRLYRLEPFAAPVTDVTPLSAETLAQVERAIEQEGWQLLLDGPNYRTPHGVIVLGRDRNGAPLTLVGMSSVGGARGTDFREPGDTYHRYEALLHRHTVVREQTFRYDIAGIEGVGWLPMFIALLWLQGMLLLIGRGVVAASRRLRRPLQQKLV